MAVITNRKTSQAQKGQDVIFTLMVQMQLPICPL